MVAWDVSRLGGKNRQRAGTRRNFTHSIPIPGRESDPRGIRRPGGYGGRCRTRRLRLAARGRRGASKSGPQARRKPRDRDQLTAFRNLARKRDTRMRGNQCAFDHRPNAGAGKPHRPSSRCRHLTPQSISGMNPLASVVFPSPFKSVLRTATDKKQPFSSADERDVRPLMVAPKTFRRSLKIHKRRRAAMRFKRHACGDSSRGESILTRCA